MRKYESSVPLIDFLALVFGKLWPKNIIIKSSRELVIDYMQNFP